MRRFLYSTLLLAFTLLGSAQETPLEAGLEATYIESVDLFEDGLYAAARVGFDELLESNLPTQSFLKEESSFYRALCALYLMNENSEYFLTYFAQTYPLSPRWQEAHRTAANYYFNNRRYKKVVQWLGGIDQQDVAASFRSEYYFKLAYSHLMIKDVDKARNLFFQGKEYQGEYRSHHRYYYGHIAYEAAQYSTAVEQFKLLVGDAQFGGVVPYYLSQIYYKTGEIDELLRVGEELLAQAVESRAAEVAKLIGEGYYQKKDWKSAALYLEKNKDLGGKLNQQDHYKLGFVLYKTSRYEEAINAFNKIHNRGDDLGQSAYYHLADCYLRTGKKTEAQTAFFRASESGKDQSLREDAYFNYAKLAYDSSTPFEQPLDIFKSFLSAYPNSRHRQEANEYLANLYLNSKDYESAMKAISAAGLDQPTMQGAYQKVAYFRGVQHFNAIQYEAAGRLFNKSLDYPLNNVYAALAHYWLAEIAYRKDDFDAALLEIDRFEAIPGSLTLSEYKRSLYNKGYAYFSKEDYRNAATTFRLFLNNAKLGKKLSNDAELRLADSYFMTAQYANAITYYTSYLGRNVPDADYAAFQRSLCYGLVDEPQKKGDALEALVRQFPTSVYATDAYFELGETYMKLGKNKRAEEIFNAFISDYPKSRFVKNAHIALGLIYRSQGSGEAALMAFKRVVESYPNTPESKEALGLAKIQFSELDQLGNYVDWIQTLTGAQIGQGALDSTLYNGAFDRYSLDDCAGAKKGMLEYIERFPDGIFQVPANYYMAECAFAEGDDALATKGYEAVEGSGALSFRKRTVERLASLYYADQDYENAFTYFQQVVGLVGNADEGRRARLGLMRCAKALENVSVVMQYAESLLQDEGLPAEWRSEALLNAARSSLSLNDSANAKRYYTMVAEEIKGEAQAESNYYLAQFEFVQEKFEAANERIFWMIDNLPTYPQWRWKSLLLMAKNYAGLEDDFQANYTLDFIIENADIGDLADAARKFKAELALLRERQAQTTFGVDSLEVEEAELEELEEIEE
ncbi:MAG: tetratricopeptide repeat protein [Schleiferiaceae bacterium]|nr:tetratricopeptide repeat protein [Schleiferiaceae bacterium]